MYCSSCGAAIAQDLSYCNRCGAKVSGGKADGAHKPAEMVPDSLVNAITAVFVVGLGAIIGLMAVMKKVIGFENDVIFAITVFCLVLMLGIEGVLIKLLLDRKRGVKEVGTTGRLKERTTKELGEAQGRALPEPVPSVTEHTTRAFEPIPGERKSK
jgi:hypothetical protein